MAWHLVTCEYPPQAGGVSDYTQLVARELALAGDEVHVWCPRVNSDTEQETSNQPGVFVHRELGRFRIPDLRRVSNLLDQFASPRRVLVQWVPHGYGFRSMNLPFCLWLWRRATRNHDVVELMVHEPCLAFGEGSWKQSGVAAVHRLMTMVLLNAAQKIWVSIPAWEARWRPYSLGRALPFRWLPVASNIEVVNNPSRAAKVRANYVTDGERIVGHFGTYDRNITELLSMSVPALLKDCSNCIVLLLGRGSREMREQLLRWHPELGKRVQATGPLAAEDLSIHVSVCDLMLQPYMDGVSSRRTSVMVGLSHGMPIVTTSGALTESLWAESNAVALVPAKDMVAFVKTSAALLSDETTRRSLSVNAKALYDGRFAVERIIAALREASV
jgi:glycosyltransferase involved in cell wall biosynthesis